MQGGKASTRSDKAAEFAAATVRTGHLPHIVPHASHLMNGHAAPRRGCGTWAPHEFALRWAPVNARARRRTVLRVWIMHLHQQFPYRPHARIHQGPPLRGILEAPCFGRAEPICRFLVDP